ncbi:MAG TPA: 3-hydroxyacyl-CoA dehydrogenase NAD-binding domain-containing protein [Terriglobales bacterium]|nr:3-hydroxyacyl-CoA dehydrogenase NAD-binding domain-containing protein [Terriglobales bacterium]
MTTSLLPLEKIRVVGLAGAGSVGTAWAALLLAAGFDVVAYDQSAAAANTLEDGVRKAWPVLRSLRPDAEDVPPLKRIKFVASLEDLARQSDLVQENVAEALEVKREVLSRIDAVLPANRLILSSSGGVPPTQLQQYCRNPERVLLGHPFHPAYIIPLVEVVSGESTSKEAADLAIDFYTRLGKRPILLRKEMVGHLTNRLQFAVLREAIHCLNEKVASAEDIDAAVRWGLGLRWALMGPLMTFNLAGGSGGVEQVVARFRDDVQTWWDALGKPELTDDVCGALFDGVRQLRRDRSNEDWALWRDAQLIELLKFRANHPYLGERQGQ